MRAENVLRKLVRNSQAAIDDGVYEMDCRMQRSQMNLADIIRANKHATLLAEIKFASPSLGKIRTLTDPASVARQMLAGGARALSVLTQPNMFAGHPSYFIRVRESVDVPLLMKDVIVDHVQIDAAQRMGADYILIIQALYDGGHLRDMDEFIAYAHRKGLGVLLEVHTGGEFQSALNADADLIGVNNRNLDTLEIDIGTTESVLKGHEKTGPILSESGIKTPEDIRYLKGCGADAFLVGSSIMKSGNIEEYVRGLVNAF